MAQSLSNVLVHIVFSTKLRHPWLGPEIRDEVHRYLAGTCREVGCPTLAVGGTDDHVHIACSLSRTQTVSRLVLDIKTSSSKWLKTKGDALRGFTWQAGYGAFSIGQSQSDTLRRYIARQAEHHRVKTFEEEFLDLLNRYCVTYDERYLWD